MKRNSRTICRGAASCRLTGWGGRWRAAIGGDPPAAVPACGGRPPGRLAVRHLQPGPGAGGDRHRLVQGDVGSGKTMVALLTMLIAKDNGFQSCMMAPTEILAQQHYNGIKDLLKDTEVNVRLLTGSTKASERKIIHQELENGELSYTQDS